MRIEECPGTYGQQLALDQNQTERKLPGLVTGSGYCATSGHFLVSNTFQIARVSTSYWVTIRGFPERAPRLRCHQVGQLSHGGADTVVHCRRYLWRQDMKASLLYRIAA